MFAKDLISLLSINIKSRTDNYSDQYNRILVVKILLVCSVIMSVNWFKDTINCINDGGLDGNFVSQTCWIQGVYIYEELKERVDDVAYYGIPKDMSHDGMYNGELCPTERKGVYGKKERDTKCKPLTKTFFLQYQWFPFYLAALAIVYYLPYVLHMYGNSDIISLKKSVKKGEATPETIVRTYFDRKTNPVRYHWFRVLFNYLIKVLYMVVNLVAFYGTNALLYGKFTSYGNKWIEWNRLENHIQYDYMGMRDHPRPGHEVLPPFGYCEVYSSSSDVLRDHANKHKFVCEMSQNVLTQYALIILWFTLIIGIVVSIGGFVILLVDHLITFAFMVKHGNMARRIYGRLTMRECEYLEFIRKRDIPFYADVLQRLKEVRLGCRIESGLKSGSLPTDSPPPGFEESMMKMI